jgi:hypothetical protein
MGRPRRGPWAGRWARFWFGAGGVGRGCALCALYGALNGFGRCAGRRLKQAGGLIRAG